MSTLGERMDTEGFVHGDARHQFFVGDDNVTGKVVEYEVPPSIGHLWMGPVPDNWEPLPRDHPDWAPLLTMEILQKL